LTTLIDSSALLGLLDGRHRLHSMLRHQLACELDVEGEVAATNYVAIETFDAVRCRLGTSALKVLVREILPALEIVWVQPAEHALALELFLASGEHGSLSMIDFTTLLVARRLGTDRCIAVDERFEQEGLF